MRITCPSCQAAYDVPASVLAARRMLRCAKCAMNFVPTVEGDTIAMPAPEPEPRAVSSAPMPPTQDQEALRRQVVATPPNDPAPPPRLPEPELARTPDDARAMPAERDLADSPPRPDAPLRTRENPAANLFVPREPDLDLDLPEPPRRTPAAVVATLWVLSLALLGGLGWGFVSYRQPIMQAWPPSARLYAALGLTT